MNRNYIPASPCQALAVKLCELAGMDLELVHAVDIHCAADMFPFVTFTTRLIDAEDVIEEVSHYQLEPL